MRRPPPTEHVEQSAVIQWWESYSRTKRIDRRLLMAIPNSQILMGSAKNKFAVMAYLRAEGFADAAPDLMLAYPKEGRTGHLFCGMFIELKRIGMKARPDQIEFASLLRKMGYNALICAGADEAIRALRAYIERGEYKKEDAT